jgi:ATPase family associated with various cellular activities (AAA)
LAYVLITRVEYAEGDAETYALFASSIMRLSAEKQEITPKMASQTATPISPAAGSHANESRAAKMLREIFESGRPLTYVRTAEEHRVGRVIREVSQGLLASAPTPVWTWSLTEGLYADGKTPEAGTQSPRGVLDFIIAHEGAGIFHLKDFHDPLRESPEIRRRLRDVYQNCLDQRKFVVITSPVRFIPEELDRSMISVELRPPDLTELLEFLREEHGADNVSEDFLHHLARALQGLTFDEARYALRRGMAAHGSLGPEALPAVLEEKQLLVNRSGVIEYITGGSNLGEVGGLEGLKSWLVERGKLFQLRESLTMELTPKGVLIMGIPGCGKSLCVKAISSHFQLPLYRVNMIEIFSGRHGKPEGAFVAACRMMEDMAPAVLWFDEIEMGITSTESSGEQGRIFAFFLTWMQEKARGLFVAATANRIDLLPAEMIRKGRFDEVFFVDLPQEEEQIEIFRIHLQRRGIDIGGFELGKLTQFTNGWTGAEIEQCVVSAVTKALLAGQPLTERDLVGEAVKIVPLSRTMKEQISHIRGWAFERAVRASPLRR